MEIITCLHCFTLIETRYRQTLLGFRKYKCPDCGKTSIYPLPPLYAKIYIGVIALVALLVIAAILNGGIPIPGLLFIAGVIALIKNRTIKSHVAATQEAFLASRKRMEKIEIE